MFLVQKKVPRYNKDTENLSSEIKAENLPNLGKEMDIHLLSREGSL
jgi:hypothetical protein